MKTHFISISIPVPVPVPVSISIDIKMEEEKLAYQENFSVGYVCRYIIHNVCNI